MGAPAGTRERPADPASIVTSAASVVCRGTESTVLSRFPGGRASLPWGVAGQPDPGVSGTLSLPGASQQQWGCR